MREQTIVWRNDFENIHLPNEYLRSFASGKAIARLKSGLLVIGYFTRFKNLNDLDFHAEGVGFYNSSVVEEFAFLE